MQLSRAQSKKSKSQPKRQSKASFLFENDPSEDDSEASNNADDVNYFDDENIIQHHSKRKITAISSTIGDVSQPSVSRTQDEEVKSSKLSKALLPFETDDDGYVDSVSVLSFGRRHVREAYTEDNLKLAVLLNRCIKRAYNGNLKTYSSKDYSRHKRDAVGALRISCEQAIMEELNFPQYRTSFMSLLDLYNLDIPEELREGVDGNNKASRKKFLNMFSSLLCDRLSTDGANNTLPFDEFAERIRSLPVAY